MAGVVWVRWGFVVVLVGVAVLCAARLLIRRGDDSGIGCGTDRIADASHGVMSLGMAAMFLPWGNPVPALYWELVFSVIAGYFAVRMARRRMRPATVREPGTDLHHVVGSLAMVYMLAAVPAGHTVTGHTVTGYSMAGMSMAGMDMTGMSSAGMASGIALPGLAWVLVVYFLVFAVRLGARLIDPVRTPAPAGAGAGPASGPREVVSSPHLLGSCLIFMGIGMSYMLVTML
ncbi:MAG TPA: DUF5134 domain-containing protein [Pseudonocardiaceae bacterium]